jgi:hypothetical protein
MMHGIGEEHGKGEWRNVIGEGNYGRGIVEEERKLDERDRWSKQKHGISEENRSIA